MTNLNAIKTWLKQPILEKKETYPSHHHISGNASFNFDVPGIDPQKLRVINKNRKIYLINEKEVVGKITTMDQIDRDELKVNYQFGRIIVSISQNMEKFKEYEAKIELK